MIPFLIFTFVIQFINCYQINIENPSVIVFHKINNAHLKINNISYRESINPLSFYYFQPGNYIVNKHPRFIWDNCNLISSNNKNNDIEISQELQILDSIQYYKYYKGPVHLLASTNIEHNTNFTWLIKINNKVVYYDTVQNLNYIQTHYHDIGSYNIQIMVRHESHTYKFYQSQDFGYTNGYQFGLWETIIEKPNDKIIKNVNDNIIFNNKLTQKYNNSKPSKLYGLNQKPITYVVHKTVSIDL